MWTCQLLLDMSEHPSMTTILLIEDNPGLQRMNLRMLRRLFPAHRIAAASTAEQAITALRQGGVALVVSDFDLEGYATGGDVLAWVRAHQPELVERFVFWSGNETTSKLHHHCLDKGTRVDDVQAYLAARLTA